MTPPTTCTAPWAWPFQVLPAATGCGSPQRTFREGEHGPEFDYDPAIRTQLRLPSKWTTMLAWWLFRRLARKRPTLLIRGALSDVLSRDIALEMKRQAPSLRLAEVPNVGHAPLLTEPEAGAAIADFLGSVA